MDYNVKMNDQLQNARDRITIALKDYPNFKGCNFSDVRAGGIQLSGNHNEIKGYIYPSYQITIEYDFSNIETAIEQFIENWIECDNPTDIEDAKLMYSQMARYGCD
jgi:hypothetical protein